MSNVASLRQIRRRIRSVENTKKITRAMEMVAAAKLRRFQDLLESFQPYTARLEELFNRLAGELPEGYDHPYLEKEASVESGPCAKRTALVLFTSDSGLCGTYNSDLEGLAREWVAKNSKKEIQFVFVGKHGAGFCRFEPKRILANFFDLRLSRLDEILAELRKVLGGALIASGVDEIVAVYTRMESLSRYHKTIERILPFSRQRPFEEVPLPYLVEPGAKTVLDRLIPAAFEARLQFIFYHALLTEQIARMSAMRQATQNAEEMIDELTLLRNKARQASITKEIIEIVSGSRAQKLK